MKKGLVLLLMVFLTLSAFKEGEKKITVFMIGDSTMANKSLKNGNPERGWGHVLGGFFTEDILVDNHAQNGRSSLSFINEGRWDEVMRRIKPGDYVIIQFGHNDEKKNPDRHTEPGSTFDDNLRKFVNETRAHGGHPILMNAIVRRNFEMPQDSATVGSQPAEPDKAKKPVEGKILRDTHGAYLDSPRNVAKEMKVPFVDANAITHQLVEGMGPVDSKKLFMWLEPNTYFSHPTGKEDNTHLNVYGARIVAGLLVDAIAQEVPDLAPYVRHYDWVVAKDGSGDFFTVQEAVNAVPDYRKQKTTTVLIRKGVYEEKLVIPASKSHLHLIGQEGAVLSYNDYASKPNCFGENKGTSGSSSCYIYATDVECENLTFENTAGRVGQAVACLVSADRVVFRNCRFLGNQDTLYNFGQFCRQYFENCYIEGTVDFIFGSSTAVFNRCTIHSLSNGYVTAPSTPQGADYGYVFYDCKLTAADEAKKVDLGRPWRTDAQSVFIRCELGKHISPAGWNNWGNKEAEKKAFFAEYQNVGEGADTRGRVAFSKQLKNLKNYSIEQVLAGKDNWNPIRK